MDEGAAPGRCDDRSTLNWVDGTRRRRRQPPCVDTRPVLLVQTALPPYRQAFCRELATSFGRSLRIAAGTDYFDQSIRTLDETGLIDVNLRNHFVLGRRLLIQLGHAEASIPRYEIRELNPRIITAWLGLIRSRLAGRRVLLWGHFQGRRVGEVHPRFIRRLMVTLSDGVIAYTFEDAERFRRSFPRKRVTVAPNATELSTESALIEGTPRSYFLYVGRLVDDKRVDTLIEGFHAAIAEGLLPDHVRLVIVGHGPAVPTVTELVDRLDLADRVELRPAAYGSAALNDLYAGAIAGVCAGYAGLNVTQSLSRGVPFITIANLNHSPEISVGTVDRSLFLAASAQSGALASTLGHVHRLVADGEIDHAAIRDETVSRYSVEAMVAGFIAATS